MQRKIDILCVGEVLIDFIGHQEDSLIDTTRDYHRYFGGSPANVTLNCKRLGLHSVMIASVGNDGFGRYIIQKLEEMDIETSKINQLANYNTSVIFISKSKATPDFIPYRAADYCIYEHQIDRKLLSETKIFHTTSFALSKNPAQETILKKAAEAFELGCKLSIDVNYSEKLWSNKEEALNVLKAYCHFNPLIKISEDDMTRLFNEDCSHEQLFDFFHKEGADIVCLTLGSKGVILSEKNKNKIQKSAIKVENILDTTGAGDAFWSGFLFAFLKQKNLNDCLDVALKLAALKLQNVGRLPQNIDILSRIL